MSVEEVIIQVYQYKKIYRYDNTKNYNLDLLVQEIVIQVYQYKNLIYQYKKLYLRYSFYFNQQ